jgi:amino acid adenylation domain-containing protein
MGVRRADRVVIQLENSVEAVIAIFGVLKAGGVFAVVNPTIKAEKLAYILNDSGAAVLIVDARLESVARGACARTRRPPAVILVGMLKQGLDIQGAGPLCWFDDLLQTGQANVPAFRGIDIDLAALIYTSGSTGVPKGAALTHRNIGTAATAITEYLGSTEHDVVLNVLPLSFDYGLYQVLMTFKVGGRLVLERSLGYPAVILDLLVREGVTGFPIVPTIAALLQRHDFTTHDLRSLRYITSTGAAFAPSHIAALRQRLPHVRIFSMYGLTECKRVSFLPPEEIDERPTSVGKPMPNVEVFVEDEAGERRKSGIGELVIRGSNVMQGYWNRPGETAEVLRPGLFPGETLLYTGDVFRIDDEGYMYYVARKDDVIKCRGEKVSPREVENALHQIPGVIEAVVVGVPDPVLGQAVKAYLRMDPDAGVSEQQVIWYSAQLLEDVLVPKSVEFVAAMPKTDSGKIDRRKLAAQDTQVATC